MMMYMKNRKQNTPVPENAAKGVNFQKRWGNFPKFIFQNILSKKQYSHNTNPYPVPMGPYVTDMWPYQVCFEEQKLLRFEAV